LTGLKGTGAARVLERQAVYVVLLGLFALMPFDLWGAGLGRAISPQALEDALVNAAEQFNVLLMYPAPLAQGVKTEGASAGLSLDETLKALLAGTALTYELTQGHILTIHARARELEARENEEAREPYEPRDGLLPYVEITGTHIPSAEPVGAQVIELKRETMRNRGYTTVADAIRALPQNFAGGPSEDTWAAGQEELYNVSRGVGVNLRGLGSASTLVLVNGRRLAAGAAEGRFVDVSAIPISAVERIEVLPDGASAIYGADAVGGVVNFILRRGGGDPESQVRVGEATEGAPTLVQLSQVTGASWEGGEGLLAAEYYRRGRLPAADRAQSQDSDLRRFGGDNFGAVEGNPGTILTGSDAWPIPSGQDGQRLSDVDLRPGAPTLHNRNEGLDLLPQHERASLVGTLHQRLSERVRVFADILLSERRSDISLGPTKLSLTVPASNPFYVNPTGSHEPVSVAYSFGPDLGPEIDRIQVQMLSATVGAEFAVGRWSITPALSFGGSRDLINRSSQVDHEALAWALADPDPATAFNPFGDGSYTDPQTLARLKVDGVRKTQNTLRTASLAASGQLMRLGARELQLAVGADVREEALSSIGSEGALNTIDLHAGRRVYAGYLELLVPLFEAREQHAGARDLRLSLASRYEHYSDFDGAHTPRVGLTWAPHEAWSVRGTYSKSFKAPKLVELDESRNFSALSVQANPASSTGYSEVLLWFGSNSALHDERASTWTVSTELKDRARGLTFGLTYFNLKNEDRVDPLDFSASLLEDPAFSDLIIRDPSSEERQSVCRADRFIGNPEDCLKAPVAALIDMRLANVDFVKTSGIDILMAYEGQGRYGRFEADFNASYLLQFSKGRYHSAVTSLLDTAGHPLRFRARGDLLWELGPIGVTSAVNYTGAYRDTLSRPERQVAAWLTWDAGFRYRLGNEAGSRFRDLSLELSVQNVFNRQPPFLNNPIGVGYDPENADLLQRFVGLGLWKTWH
jgi:iron complex outermembrane recepter protein